MRENGIEAAVKKSKCPIFGICGGYQMLGEKSPIQTAWKTAEVFAVWDFCR